MEHHHDVTRFFKTHTTDYSIVILNQPINETAFDIVSPHASLLICADGGSNRLLDIVQQRKASNSTKPLPRLPDAIIGDLDSALPSTLSHYSSLNVPIINDSDQYSTDLTKSLKFIRSEVTRQHQQTKSSSSLSSPVAENAEAKSSSPVMDVLLFGGLGGRVDQAFSLIHHFFAAPLDPSWLNGNMYLISDESLTFILQPGRNIIHCGPLRDDASVADEEKFFDENVGIIPVMGKAIITIRGFEWDVENWETEFGGQVSTSNHLRAETVEVETNERVLFTLEFSNRLSEKKK